MRFSSLSAESGSGKPTFQILVCQGRLLGDLGLLTYAQPHLLHRIVVRIQWRTGELCKLLWIPSGGENIDKPVLPSWCIVLYRTTRQRKRQRERDRQWHGETNKWIEERWDVNSEISPIRFSRMYLLICVMIGQEEDLQCILMSLLGEVTLTTGQTNVWDIWTLFDAGSSYLCLTAYSSHYSQLEYVTDGCLKLTLHNLTDGQQFQDGKKDFYKHKEWL